MASSDDHRPTRPYSQEDPGAAEPAAAAELELQAPSRLGRYVLLGFLGAGGMGVVHSAYDPQLDRKVALKLLRPQPAGRDPEDWQGRLLGEARAMARLSHPNVVHVHDVGEVGSQVYLAMELVEGQDLRRWMREPGRTWEQIHRALVQAGRGLAAAHAAGLVHRDFKPENVLVGQDGRARVTDFGLAAVRGPGAADPEASTQLVGTLGYMAPEQLCGAPSDPRADQFSFCVTLYEALYGQRPFLGENAAQWAVAASQGILRPPPVGTRVPGWLHAALSRGLAADPGARFESMEALLLALRPPVPALHRRGLRISVSLAVGVLAFITLWSWNQERLRRSCDGGQTRLVGAWDPSTRERVHAAFLRTANPAAVTLSQRVEEALEAYRASWLATRREVCEATRVRGVQPPALMEVRLACLERRASELHALTRLFSVADDPMLLQAPQAVNALGAVATCASALPESPLVEAEGPPDPSLQEALSDARALKLAGRYAQSEKASALLLERARKAGHRGLAADAALQRCEAGVMLEGPFEQACLDAALLAEEAGLQVRAATAWSHLVLLATDRGEHPQARRWLQIARSMVARLGGRSEEAKAQLASAEAFAAFGAGQYTEAAEAWSREATLRERALPDQGWDRAAAITNLGTARMREGKLPQALEAMEQGLALHRAVLGEDHPQLAAILTNIGMVRRDLGQLAEARSLFLRSIALQQRFGSEGVNFSLELSNLAGMELERGAYAEALASYGTALELREQHLGLEHPILAASHLGKARALLALGRPEEAEAEAARALHLRQQKYGPRHPMTADALGLVGMIQSARGEPKVALSLLQQALEINEETRDEGHQESVQVRLSLGEVQLHAGKLDEARAQAERAAALLEGRDTRPAFLARSQRLLALVLQAQGQREGAQRAAQRADGYYRGYALPTEQGWVQVRALLDALAPVAASP